MSDQLLDSIVPAALRDRLRGGTVITIGNFDGVHRGHQTILRDVEARARRSGWTPTALTFEPHPVTVFRDMAPEEFRISTSDEREARLLKSGVDEVVTIPFSREFADLSARAFVFDFLLDRLSAREVHIGYDFAFGKGREGSTADLQRLCGERDVEVAIHHAFELDGEPVSSTRVRERLRAADMPGAEHLLGYPYTLTGVQAPGAQRGRKMGVPTVNLYPEGRMLPPHGVYVTVVESGGKRWEAITNIGTRPTFEDDDRISIETHVLEEFAGIEEGALVELSFLAHVRGERRFENADALRAQIGEDVGVAKEVHAQRATQAR